MLDLWRADGREVAVVGLGRSGVAATRLLRAHGIAAYASDAGTGEALESAAAELRAAGAGVDVGRHDLARIGRAQAAVLSPGVPPEAPPVRAARAAGYRIRAEIDLGLEVLGGLPYVGITGTNGKSTVTALVAHLLRVAGFDAEAAGNIGVPLCEVALRPVRPSWLSVEFSSFQLHDCPGVNPVAGILTNLAPDHLDRYPTLEAYYADKAGLFANAGETSVWVTNADNPPSQEMVRAVAGRQLRFSVAGRADGWFDRDGGQLMLGGRALLARGAFPLLGDHNVANALAAALAVTAAGIPVETLADGLRSFPALTHRLEPVGSVHGVLWINDSKATNVASTTVAVAAMDRPFVLLLGGRHKGEPYTSLAPLLDGRARAVIAFGESAPIVERDLGGLVRRVEGGFDQVLGAAAALAHPGDAVLLSPACSSYDMFRNYEERGRQFRAWVESR
ncbi:MAG TPA: UDP-N-acetylmuramoyl-L-alanine--D-glutamate ligase [Gemmatimonadales bacterium]